jgi:hypothetical protein
MNRWGIPKWLEEEVRERDKTCVYCGIKLVDKVPRNGSRKSMATWEHIINDARIVNRKNIVRCCSSCNSSKGTKALFDWINSDYCKKKGIKVSSVSKIVRVALRSI